MAEVKTLGVVGAGPMGAGIAQIGLTAGLDVVLYDLSAEALAKSGKDIIGRIARLVEKGQLPEGYTAEAEKRLTLAEGLEAFAPCEVVVEAIIERLEPKQKLFTALEAVIAPTAILASNTSSLSVAAIAAGCDRKEQVCGLHFFNPVPLMKLVEVITAPATSQETADRAYALSKTLGKVPVLVKDGPGFLVNLGGRAYVTEGLHIVQEGVADIPTIDRIMREAMGFRMGPFELMDLTGIDVNFPASTFIYEGYQHDARIRTTTLHQLMYNAGRFGRKTGQGFYSYAEDAPKPAEGSSAGEAHGFTAAVPELAAGFDTLVASNSLTIDAKADVILIAPAGEDAATASVRLGLDPAKVVAVDFSALDRGFVTLMAPLGGGAKIGDVAAWLRSQGLKVATIKDSPGFVVQRIVAMIANLGCEMAQIGIGTPSDIDLAMKLALNYPQGPLEFAAHFGLDTTHRILANIQAVTGSDRYRPSLWLRRRAQLGLPIHQAD